MEEDIMKDELGSVVKFEDEKGKSFEMLILKEFEYKSKKYAVLMNDDCNCDDNCDCGDDCDCECNDKCDCGDECKCDDNCDCGCQEKEIYILEISKDKDGNEIFKEIEDEKTFEEVIKEADKVLYED
jgi:hypothetical protein